jgi:hypothetical protein
LPFFYDLLGSESFREDAITQPQRILWFALLAALVFLLPARTQGQSAPATDNATIQLTSPTSNNSSSANLGVQGPNLEEAYIRLDLFVLPSGWQASNINKATPRLFLADVTMRIAGTALEVTWRSACARISQS